MKIKKGELFIFTVGEYSDYGIERIGKAKQDIDVESLRASFKEVYNGRLWNINENFIATLFESGLVEPVHAKELFVHEKYTKIHNIEPYSED